MGVSYAIMRGLFELVKRFPNLKLQIFVMTFLAASGRKISKVPILEGLTILGIPYKIAHSIKYLVSKIFSK